MTVMSDPDTGKDLVRRLVDEVMNQRRLQVLDEIYSPRLAPAAHRWVGAFLESFTDVDMRIVELLSDGDRVIARFSCSGTHVGRWLGHPATGRRFRNIPEVYFFTVIDGQITAAWGLEDTWSRLGQLGLAGSADKPD
jgi:predicted ester cyclase